MPDRGLLSLILAVLTALALACTSGPTFAPTPTPVRPALGFDKLQVDLGAVPLDQRGTQTFLALNWGNTPLRVGPLRVAVIEGCDQANVPEGEWDIPSRSFAVLPVNFGVHKASGPHKVLVRVPSSDVAAPLSSLTVRFVVREEEPIVGTGPRLQVDKESIDTGIVPYDWPMYEVFTLRNMGDEPLVLSGTPKLRVEEGC